MARNESFFQRLTRLFRSGPAIQRRIKGQNVGSYYDTKLIQGNYGYRAPAPFGFGRENSPFSVLGSYGMLDRMARYAEFAEMEYCVHGDTKIAVPGGFKTIKELADEYGLDGEFIVYSWDHSKGKIVPAVGRQARQTRTDHAYKVTFDSGKEIIGTSNHRLMKRDGTYCEIGDLKPGDAMMPFYRRSVASHGVEGQENCYQAIYTMSREENSCGWTAEHKLLAEFILGRKLAVDEVVHHKNFLAHDNRIENLEVMNVEDHRRLHAEILNGKKWDYKTNSEWIEIFKKRHSAWMKANNPADREDITFERILNWCDANTYNLYKVARAFDTNINTIKRKLISKGFNTWTEFATAYCPNWKSESCNNVGKLNPRYHNDISFGKICDVFEKGMSKKALAEALGVSVALIQNRLKDAGYASWTEFASSYENHKVVSVEYYGKIPLYDLTVDGYKNFATDSVISHNTPEIATALDIYADETAGGDENGHSFHAYSDNVQIKRALEELFYDVLNVEFNIRAWARNIVKYGDFFLYNEVLPDIGVINTQPIPVNDVEREEGFDEEDPYAIRFKWLTRGNVYLENWQVTHFRILGNDLFLPYGTSVLEPARRIWRQLIMMEDAMLVYRVVRSPERRVFYIDVGNIAPNDVPSYMEATKATLRSHSVIDRTSGRQDMRYNPLAIDEDYYIPVRGAQSGTKIETLAGGQHVTATEDVQYIQSKLFSALKVPKPYLNYDENLSSKATLAQTDIRFSRTIAAIQKIIVAEMTKLAMIHLYAKGFDGEDLINFDLRLSNPSTVAIQQKLELWATKMDIAGTAKETRLVDERWIQKTLLELTDDDIDQINKGLYQDKVREVQLDQVVFEEENYKPTTTDAFSPSGYGMSGEDIPKGVTHQPPPRGGSEIVGPGPKKNSFKVDYKQGSTPIKATPFLTRNRKNRKRRVGAGGRANTANPDFGAMLHPGKNRSLSDIYGFKSRQEGIELDGEEMVLGERKDFKPEPVFPGEIKSIFRRMSEHFFTRKRKSEIIAEELEADIDDEIDDEDNRLIEGVVDKEKNFGLTTTSLKEAFDTEEEDEIEIDDIVDLDME